MRTDSLTQTNRTNYSSADPLNQRHSYHGSPNSKSLSSNIYTFFAPSPLIYGFLSASLLIRSVYIPKCAFPVVRVLLRVSMASFVSVIPARNVTAALQGDANSLCNGPRPTDRTKLRCSESHLSCQEMRRSESCRMRAPVGRSRWKEK